MVEKPLSNKLNEIKKLVKISNINNKLLKVGYNLRFDDGLIKSKELLDKKLIGNVYYIKIFYANGAAKTNSNKIGSLLDMGTHSINLLIWLMNNNDFKIIKAISQKNEFCNKTKVDNGFILLKSKNIHSYIHHGFCTWKNKFYLEISEKVSLGIRKFPDGKPKIKNWNFKRDNSWKNELLFIFNSILNKKMDYKKINLESIQTINTIKGLI